MGFKPKKTVYNLDFTNHGDDYEGLEVKTGMLALGTFLKVSAIVDTDLVELTEADVDELFTHWSSILLSWNVEDDDGEPVPTTKEGLYSLEMPFAMTIITTWRDAMKGVASSDPLGSGSNGGGTSEEESIPMEPLSASHAS